MPFFVNSRSLPTPPPFVFFIIIFTIAAAGLNHNPITSIAVACVTLLFQIPIFISATNYAKHNHALVSSLHQVYLTNALAQFFIVRILVPYLFAWIFTNFYLACPTLVNYVLDKLYQLIDTLLNLTQVLEKNAMRITFGLVENARNNPGMLSDLKTNYLWLLEGGMAGGAILHGIIPDQTPRSKFEIFKWTAGNALSSLLGKLLARIPLFLILPTEIVKYYVLATAAKHYQSQIAASTCQHILLMALVLSLPIANIQVLLSTAWLKELTSTSGVEGLYIYVIGLIAAYASSMISCAMLGVVIAENTIFGVRRFYATLRARVMSLMFMSMIEVLIALSYLYGIVPGIPGLTISCTMLLILLSGPVFLWRRIMQLMLDEHVINTRSRQSNNALS